MNSVFSAFKSNKADSKAKFANKKLTQDSSYENLRHIREIGSSAKMSNFVDDADDDTNGCSTQSIRLGKRCQQSVVPLVPSPITELSVELELAATDIDLVDCAVVSNYNATGSIGADADANYKSAATVDTIENNIHNQCVASTQKVISASESNLCDSVQVMHCGGGSETPKPSPCSSLKSFPTSQNASAIPKVNFSSEGDILSSYSVVVECSRCSSSCNCSRRNGVKDSAIGAKIDIDDISVAGSSTSSQSLPTSCSTVTAVNGTSEYGDSSNKDGEVSSAGKHAPIIIAAGSRGCSESNLSANKTNRFQKRLSLSGFTNNSMPSVHGRPATSASASGNNGSETKKTRLSTHQRNLSLDFR